MLVRDRTLLLRSSRWRYWLRLLINSWFTLLGLTILGILIALWLDAEPDSPIIFLVWLTSRTVFILALPAWVAWFAYKLGLIRCPCCDLRFDSRMWFPIRNECENCGFNQGTVSRRGDF
jgi:hypothetical protein